MALVIKDRIKETTSTSGTGSVTLLGPSQGYQGFSSIGDGNTTYYAIVGTAEWEVGIGTYSAGVLSRDTVLGSSANNGKVGLSTAVKDVFCTLPASKAVITDALPVVGAYNTASPNNTVNVASLTTNVSSTNGDLALVPKGSGALMAQIPTGSATGGLKRGSYAVDWQFSRSAAAMVASGNYSVIGGGTANKASGELATIAGGTSNEATGSWSSVLGGGSNKATANRATVAGGQGNTASGQYSFIGGGSDHFSNGARSVVAGGNGNSAAATASGVLSGQTNLISAASAYSAIVGGLENTVSGSSAIIGSGQTNTASGSSSAIVAGSTNTASGASTFVGAGDVNTASGANSVVGGGTSNIASGDNASVLGGSLNVADGAHSTVIGGKSGKTHGIGGFHAFPSVSPISGQLTQSGMLVLGVNTTNATPTVARSTTAAAGTSNQLVLENYTVVRFLASVIAASSTGTSKSWSIEGHIKRDSSAASTTLGIALVSVTHADSGTSGWSVAATADTTNGALAITVTGQVSTTIRWVCSIQSTEVAY